MGKIGSLIAGLLFGVVLGGAVGATYTVTGQNPKEEAYQYILSRVPCQVRFVYGISDGSTIAEGAIDSTVAAANQGGWETTVLRKAGPEEGTEYVVLVGEACPK